VGKITGYYSEIFLRLLKMDSQEVVRACYDWNINNLKRSAKQKITGGNEIIRFVLYSAKPDGD
jgi:hypothetical protein